MMVLTIGVLLGIVLFVVSVICIFVCTLYLFSSLHRRVLFLENVVHALLADRTLD